MNLIILLTLIAMGFNNWQHLAGIVGGLTFCYFFLDKKREDSSIKYHLTHWSWWDLRI